MSYFPVCHLLVSLLLCVFCCRLSVKCFKTFDSLVNLSKEHSMFISRTQTLIFTEFLN